MKAKLFTILMICSLGLGAQSWCPTGANWYYPYYPCMSGGIGYTHYYYSADTIVAGQNCKKISATAYDGYLGSTIVDTSFGHTITRESGDTVYYFNDTVFVPYLYFAANTGDTIVLPNWIGWGGKLTAVVDSNGKQLIANDSLRYYYYHFTDTCFRSFYQPYKVIERIGTVDNDFIPVWLSNCGAVEDFCFPFFSCYGDSSIPQFSINPSQPCYDLTLDVKQVSSTACLQIEPNPASGFVTVNYSNETPAYLEITNLLGQQVYRQPLPNANHCQVDISRFAAGAYLVAIIWADGVRDVVKLQIF